jgi:hypothetical protein
VADIDGQTVMIVVSRSLDGLTPAIGWAMFTVCKN